MSELVLPQRELILPELQVVRFVVDHAIEPLGLRTERIFKKIQDYVVAMAGFSDGVENKILDWLYRSVAMTPASPRFLALTTSAVNETNTAGTITEAAYTGYARLSLADAVFGAAASGEVHNTAQQTFAACTAGTSTVIGWAMCSSSSGAGDIYHFGTCTSTVISTTQTPATINASALSLSLD
jgi:hypothetical protein